MPRRTRQPPANGAPGAPPLKTKPGERDLIIDGVRIGTLPTLCQSSDPSIGRHIAEAIKAAAKSKPKDPS